VESGNHSKNGAKPKSHTSRKFKTQLNMKKTTLFCLILLFFVAFSCSKERTAAVYGVVTDSETHQPIEGVTVTVSSTSEWVTTESDGYYEFNDLDLRLWDEHIISAMYIGYISKDVTITLSSNDRKEVNIEMKKY